VSFGTYVCYSNNYYGTYYFLAYYLLHHRIPAGFTKKGYGKNFDSYVDSTTLLTITYFCTTDNSDKKELSEALSLHNNITHNILSSSSSSSLLHRYSAPHSSHKLTISHIICKFFSERFELTIHLGAHNESPSHHSKILL